MIRIQYKDVIIGGQLYCSVQAHREMGAGEYAVLSMIRWFGSAEILPPAGRGELLALAGTIGTYRHELLLVSPSLSQDPDKVLGEWRAKFERIEYCNCDESVANIMTTECHALFESDERSIADEMIIRNFTIFNNQSSNNSLIIGDTTQLGNCIYVLVDKSSKILSCRRPFTIRQLDAMIAQAKDHDLLVYCSSCKLTGKTVTADGPWIVLSQSSHNVVPINHTSMPPTLSSDILSADNESNWDSIVQTKDGMLVCPYCAGDFKSKAGMTNHVKAIHTDQLDDYRIRSGD